MLALGLYIGGPLVAAFLNAAVATLELSLALGSTFVKSLTLAAGAIRMLGAAILSTPVGWILAGIAALAGAVYLVYKNWDEFCAYWTGIWDRVTSAFDQGFIQGVLAVLYEFNPGLILMNAINGIIKWLFGIDLRAAGMAFIGSFYDGLKEKWSSVVTWLEGAVKKLTRFLPGWIKEKPGLNIGIDKAATAPAQAAREVTEKTAAITRNVTENSVIRHQLPTPVKTATEKVEAGMMQATRVEVQKLALPEPLLVHKPAQIDASVTIQHLTIQNPNGTPEEIRRAVNSALARHAGDQRAALASSLSD